MLDLQKADELLSELELIQTSGLRLTEQFIAVAKLFYRFVICASNGDLIAFRNMYARCRYVLSKLSLSPDQQKNADAFRRFLKNGDSRHFSPESLQESVALLKSLIAHASGGHSEGDTNSYFTNGFPQRNLAALKELKVLCDSWSELRPGAAGMSFSLTAYPLLDLTVQLVIHIDDDQYYKYTDIHPLLEKGFILTLQHVRAVAGSTHEYETTFDTLITVEPDYLIEATSIGECFNFSGSSSDIYFLNQLVKDLPGSPALKGSIVGYYLDEFVRMEVKGQDEIFETAQRTNAMKAAQLGHQEMQAVKQSIYKDHLPNIKSLVRREKDSSIWIEPTFFSTVYGLQGRLDLLSNKTAEGTRNIVELKSGNPTDPTRSIAWINHKLQVVCYDMMLESTYGKEREGSNAVYYSKCTVAPYRVIVSEQQEKKQVLGKRNEIVVSLYRLAAGDFSTFNRIKERGIPGLPRFNEEALARFQQHYQPGRITTYYYQEMTAFLLRELINTKVGHLLHEEEETGHNGFAGLWLDSESEKLGDFRLAHDLRIENIDPENGIIALNFTTEIEHSFRKGDPIVLYPKTANGYTALSQHILKGSLASISPKSLVVELNNKQTAYDFIESHEFWAIEPDIFERNSWSAISCLFNVLTASERKKRLLLGHDEPGFERQAEYRHPNLLDAQRLAVQKAFDAKDYFLLQGPPGTGKTSTFLVNYIQESLRRGRHRIVVLAFTNKAVEKICEAFRAPRHGAPIDYLRMGSRHVDDDALLERKLSGQNPDNWKQTINGYRVFVSTVSTFQNNWQLLRTFFSFDEVIIDEASQITEASVAGILALFNKFILIGDQKQLPAVITQDERLCKTNAEFLKKMGVKDFRVSLFQRLIENARDKGWEKAYSQLSDHYRMHEEIAGLITQHYRVQLNPGTAAQRSAEPVYVLPTNHVLHKLTSARAVFVESPSDSGVKRNSEEAKLVAAIVHALTEYGNVQTKDIGIITPFRAQIGAIKSYLSPKLLSDEELVVDTVERYQGDERKVVIFSTVICHPRQLKMIQNVWEDDISRTDRKLLVSISRASEQLIVLGNAAVLRASPSYKDVVDKMKVIKLDNTQYLIRE